MHVRITPLLSKIAIVHFSNFKRCFLKINGLKNSAKYLYAIKVTAYIFERHFNFINEKNELQH